MQRERRFQRLVGMERHPNLRESCLMTMNRSLTRRAALGAAIGTVTAARSFPAFAQEVPSGHSPATQATPVASGGSGAPSLSALLSFMPDPPEISDNPVSVGWYYADIAQQFEALGLKHDVNGIYPDEQKIVPPTIALAVAADPFRNSLREGFTDLIGFDPWGSNQTLHYNEPPNQVDLYRGPFDTERAIAAWQAAGYKEDTAPTGETIFTIGREAEIDLAHPIQSVVIANLNNIAIVDDVIITSPFMDRVVAAIEAHRNGSESDSPLVASVPPEFASGIRVELGSDFALPPETPAKVIEDVPVMPDYRSLILGVLAGARMPSDGEDAPESTGTCVARLEMASEQDASTALTVVEKRLGKVSSLITGEPMSDLFELLDSRTAGPIAEFEFALLRTPTAWLTMVQANDLLLFMPGPN